MEAQPSRFARSLAEFCRATAAWRRRKAEEYDRDERNLRTASALEALADHILTLPADDPRLAALQRLAGTGDDFTPDQRVLYELGRFRFHHPDAGLDPFLDTLVTLAEADRGEAGHFGGRLPEGDDPWA
ncbi:MAG: hypothetical protein K0S78_3114 [Thermomicrobiales bacterium]|nr:hypothetical protein [Thermomicrobiales bacterium]MDF3038299.1 hypothetical protein [Thermomicrobiales bacterium]